MSLDLRRVTAVILAGGLGSRIRHLVSDLPKPMVPVRGQPFLAWIIRYLSHQGVIRVLISTGYRSEIIERDFQDRSIDGAAVRCFREEQLLGTAGGFLNAVEISRESPDAWLVLNGDSLVLADLASAAALLADPSMDGVIAGVAMRDAARYGTLSFDHSGRLLGFEEKRPGAGLINAGMYLLRPGLLARFPHRRPLSFETEVFPHLLEHGAQLRVFVTQSPFLDIGTPESLALAEAFIGENLTSLQAS